MRLIKLIVFLGSIISIFACNDPKRNPPLAVQGILDLSDWDFEKDGILKLDGKWDFYWNKLYTPDDFRRLQVDTPALSLSIPGTWNEQTKHTHKLPGKGFATYHLKIKLKHPYPILGIKCFDAASSFKLWINGQSVASNGVVSDIPDKMKPQFLPMLRSFTADTSELDIIVQVSNNFHSKGGIWSSYQLGTMDQLINKHEREAAFETILFGIMFILFIYHIWIFFLRKSEKIALWFGLLCLSLLFRSMLTDDRFLYVFFPSFNLNLGLRLEYLTLSYGSSLFIIFVYYLFTLDFSKTVLKIVVGITLIETLVICLTSTSFYTSMLSGFQILVVFKAFYIILIVSPKAIKNKRSGSVIFLIITLTLVACVINDMLLSLLIINSRYLTPLGFFMNILLQAYILASRISYAFETVEKSTLQLNAVNAELGQKYDQIEMSEKKFRNIINTSSNLISILDLNATLTFASPSFKKTIGFKPEEMIGISAYDFMHPDDRQSVHDSFEKAFHNPRKLLNIEGRLRKKDGDYIYVDIRANPLFESNRRITGAIVMMNDITDRKLDQQRQEAYNKTLELKVEERTLQLQAEKKKSDDLLLNILPEEVAEELKEKGSSDAKQYDHVTVLFTDFVNFTGISEQLTPVELVAEIHKNFTAFDAIMEQYGIEKIKTIGDAYLAVCGLPNPMEDHAQRVVKAAIAIQAYMNQNAGKFQIRIGIHSGPVVAGIVGVKKFAYDIWGDTVNTASRMESNSDAGEINISGATYELVKDEFVCTYRGKLDAKNKGELDMYFVNRSFS
ncbi:MAG: adenylate/guanylate cyclase domain-containing protein [Bacteroidota bacterium]|nr:adenylate/guanylate cyclase domain-containing protein [Bacteroidota bacterium]